MAEINIPDGILQKETLKTLPAKEKEEYLRNLLKKILELNPDGITISQVKEATGLTYSTIWHHLEMLSHTAQGQKISHGNVDVYFPTGNATHLNDYDYGKVRYTFSIVENKEGKFICVHEKRQNRLGNHTVCSGLTLPYNLINEFISVFGKVKQDHLNEKKK